MFEGIQNSFREPYDITVFKTTRSDCFEWVIPVQQVMSLLVRKKIIIIDIRADNLQEILPLPTTYQNQDQQSPYEQNDKH